jgi:hypothetical protein
MARRTVLELIRARRQRLADRNGATGGRQLTPADGVRAQPTANTGLSGPGRRPRRGDATYLRMQSQPKPSSAGGAGIAFPGAP